MGESGVGAERAARREAYDSFRDQFSSAPIRLMSRTVSRMRAQGYDDLATAIGDLDWRTVPPMDPVDPALRHDWQTLLETSIQGVPTWLAQLGVHPMGYNLESIGHPVLSRAWSAMWTRHVGIEVVNRPRLTPQVFVFHGGNQAVQAALLAVAERRRERTRGHEPATVLVPVPTFSCPLDQMALQGMRVLALPPGASGLDPAATDLEQVPADAEVDGVYLMPVTNPTGRTLPPDQLAAFVAAVLDRWPHAAVILDSVYVRLHPDHRELLAWYGADPRFERAVMFIDSLSKSHGVTGLRAGALLTRADDLGRTVNRYSQNVMAGPSNVVQAVMLGLLAPFVTGDEEMQDQRQRLSLRIGRHLQRRRHLLLQRAFASHAALLEQHQPVLPDPERFDWEGSMYAVVRLSDRCLQLAADQELPPTVAFYLETGIGGVPLDGFCRNPNLEHHGLVVNAGDERLVAFQEEARRSVRLSFGMTPPPLG